MKVVEFQIQITDANVYAQQFIQMIDCDAPIPEPLEGGDGKGPLYMCILDIRKLDNLQKYATREGSGVRVYTNFFPFEVEDSLYSPQNYVRWNFGKHATIENEE